MIDFMLERLLKQFLERNGYSFNQSLIEPQNVRINPPNNVSYSDMGGLNVNVEEVIETMPAVYDNATGRNFYFNEIGIGLTTSIVGKIDFKNAIMLLNTKRIELPVYCCLTMNSANNKFLTSKTAYDELNAMKYQFFTDFLEITVSNVSPESFIPFNLEFLKIIPKR